MASPSTGIGGTKLTLSREDRVRELAKIAGIAIADDEVEEVATRFESLMLELERLKELDLSDVQAPTVFPDEEE
jgi:Asp-tRNA(Asn)/Glu-tRNA(Gln) amidotransferase C subunit